MAQNNHPDTDSLSVGPSDNLTSLQELDIRRRSLPMLTIDRLRSGILTAFGDGSRHLLALARQMYERLDEYDPARRLYDAGDPRWLITALQATDRSITPWIVAQGIQDRLEGADNDRQRLDKHISSIRSLLDTYRSICLYLLEGSSFLRNCATTQERVMLQGRLSALAEKAGYCDTALGIIARGEHEQFIATLLGNMKKSGFIYHPHKQFQILMTIFKIFPRLINAKMGDFFDAILGWERGYWQNEPFRGAFVEMLEMFINDQRERIDEFAGLEAKDDNDSYVMLVQALAIQLLLANDSDHVDRLRNQAMLYRYLTMLPAVNRENLADRAFVTLAGIPPRALEFQWSEANQVTLLGHRLGADGAVWPATAAPRRFTGRRAQVVIDGSGLRIEPVGNATLSRPALPAGLLPWHQMQVMTYDEIASPTRGKLRDISRLGKMWNEIEASLFDTASTVQHQVRKVTPEPGDTVHVIIDDTDINDDNVLHCTIVDDQFEGEGWLHARDIVHWFGIDMHLSYFKDSQTGKPLVYEVTVFSRNKFGDLQFRMAQQVTDFIWNSVNHGDEFVAVIANVTASKQYTCLSREGYSFWADAAGEFDSLRRSTFVRVRVTEVRSGNAIYGEIVEILDDRYSFPHEQPFATLMQHIGMPLDDEAETPDTAESHEEMTAETMHELTLLVRRIASVIPDDYVGTYNYLSVARLMALAADDTRQAELCRCHTDLLQLLASYDTQERLSTDEVERHSRRAASSPVMQRLHTMLWLVSCIDNPLTGDRVWEMTAAGNQAEALMARLVLSLNMLGDETVKEQRSAIKARIKQMLHMSSYDDQSAKYYGSESLHVEFKTSVITPPDNGMRRDVDTQTRNIMRVICGFLNADGGTLYLGVRDNGVENGLEQDLKYFKSRDKLDLHVRNSVHDLLGATANNFVDGSWDTEAKHDVYVLNIKPCPHLIRLADIVWVRQGTSTRQLDGEDLEHYCEDRQRLFMQQDKLVAPTVIDDAPAESAPRPKTAPPRPEEVVAVATSRHRNNVLHDYEDGYVPDVAGYVYFKPGNKFEFSPTDIYIEHESQLALGIHEDELQGFIVLVFDNGNVLKVAMKEILEKMPGQSYNYGNGQRLVFACPLRPDQALLMVMRDGKNNFVYRVERAAQLDQDKINASGIQPFDAPFNGFIACDIVAQRNLSHFEDGMDIPARQVGYSVKRGNLSFEDAIEKMVAQAGAGETA